MFISKLNTHHSQGFFWLPPTILVRHLLISISTHQAQPSLQLGSSILFDMGFGRWFMWAFLGREQSERERERESEKIDVFFFLGLVCIEVKRKKIGTMASLVFSLKWGLETEMRVILVSSTSNDDVMIRWNLNFCLSLMDFKSLRVHVMKKEENRHTGWVIQSSE